MTFDLDRARAALARIPTGAAAAALLALFAILALVAAFRDSATYDETVHIASGFAIADRGDFRMAPDHPPLAKAWAALPLLFGNTSDVEYASPAWRQSDAWKWGFAFLYGPPEARPRRDPDARVVPARIMIILLGIALGVVVFSWARTLWGDAGALVALGLYSLSPTVLAHAHLVTTDLGAALGYALTVWCFWRYCSSPSWKWTAATSASLGAAVMMKITAVFLGPLLVMLALAWILAAPAGTDRLKRAQHALITLSIAAVATYASVWAAHGFRYSMSPDAAHRPDWQRLEPAEPGLRWQVLSFANRHRLLPEAFTFGLTSTQGIIKRYTFLNGEIYWGSRLHYFPEAFLLKTTPALLGLVAWVVVAGLRRSRGRSLAGWFIALPPLFYLVVAMTSGVNSAHRHLLPMYPFLFVAAGAIPALFAATRRAQIALVVLLAAHAVSSFWSCPRYLGYFNALAGGSSHGWKFLVDANIDWGQDLKRLREKMDEHRIPHVYLFYFGSADPRAYGVEFRKCAVSRDMWPAEPAVVPGPGDVLAVSVTLRQMMEGRGADEIRTLLVPFDRAGDGIFLYRVPD